MEFGRRAFGSILDGRLREIRFTVGSSNGLHSTAQRFAPFQKALVVVGTHCSWLGLYLLCLRHADADGPFYRCGRLSGTPPRATLSGAPPAASVSAKNSTPNSSI